MSKITKKDLRKLLLRPDAKTDEILKYFKIKPGKGGTDFELIPRKSVAAAEAVFNEFEADLRSGLDTLNKKYRRRRQRKFNKRVKKPDHPPVLVSEGDSWFQFPCLIEEVVDQLEDDFLIWSLGAAGDTAENMVFSKKKKYHTEYMKELYDKRGIVEGFMFSAAGNDAIGEDPKTQEAAILSIVKEFNGDTTDIEGHINASELENKLKRIKDAYTTVIEEVQANKDFGHIPIFVHGYDYVFPYPWGDDDPRKPFYTKKDNWLGQPLNKRKIFDHGLRRGITSYLIDQLYALLEEIATKQGYTNIWLIDCRNSIGEDL